MYNWTRMLMIFPMLVLHMSELVLQAYSRVWLAKNPCRIFICGEKSCIVMIWYVMIAIYTVYRYLQYSAVAKNNDNILSLLLHPKNLLGSHLGSRVHVVMESAMLPVQRSAPLPLACGQRFAASPGEWLWWPFSWPWCDQTLYICCEYHRKHLGTGETWAVLRNEAPVVI